MHYKDYVNLPLKEKWDGFTLDYKYIEGFSPLFYETGGTHRDLDNDADHFLLNLVTRYWVNWPGKHSVEADYVLKLLEKSDELGTQQEEFFYSSEYYQNTERKVQLRRLTHREKHPDEVIFFQFMREKNEITERIYEFIPIFLKVLINSAISFSEGYTDLQEDPENTAYVHSIIQNPAKYLPHYFHDQMVFDNYVQYITVPKLDEDVVEMLDSGMLLEPLDDDPLGWRLEKIMNVVRKNYRGWWT